MKKFILFSGRHPHPETEGIPSVYEEVMGDIFSPWVLQKTQEFCVFLAEEDKECTVYVTGLTPGVTDLIFFCNTMQKNVKFLHYDRNSDTYREVPLSDRE